MKYLSLLRGINVGGQKSVNMHELRSLYVQLGLDNVVTYIQSGNVVFDSSSKNKTEISKKIENAIYGKFKFHVPVEIRSKAELAAIIKNCPYAFADTEDYGTRILVSFLSDKPSKANVNNLLEYVIAPEQLVVHKTEAYLFCPNGYGKSKLSNRFLEQKLNVGATTRNWKSVNTLFELLQQ